MSHVSGRGLTLFRAREPTGSGWGGRHRGLGGVPTGASDALRTHSFRLNGNCSLHPPSPLPLVSPTSRQTPLNPSRPNFRNLFPKIKSQVHSNSSLGKPQFPWKRIWGSAGLGESQRPWISCVGSHRRCFHGEGCADHPGLQALRSSCVANLAD